jgi:hypothetical protein
MTRVANTANISGGNRTGGIAGNSWGALSQSYNTGTITGTSDLGGLIGHQQTEKTITDCYAAGGLVNGGAKAALVGSLDEGNAKVTIINCHVFGDYAKATYGWKKGTHAYGNIYYGGGCTSDNITESAQKTDTEFTDGTVVSLLNNNHLEYVEDTLTNVPSTIWVQGAEYPVLAASSAAPVPAEEVPDTILTADENTEYVETDTDVAPENIKVVWGAITNVLERTAAEEKDFETFKEQPVEFGVQVLNGDAAGYYPALNYKEGKFGIKLKGSLVDSSLQTKLYLKIGNTYYDAENE